MYKTILKNAGLTDVQAEIYEFLLNNSDFKASTIAREIKRPRGVVYKGLDELIELELAEKKDDQDMISTFRALSPGKIGRLFNQQEKKLKSDWNNFNDNLPSLSALFNLANHKPGVRFFEDEDGAKKVLADTLTSQTEILTIADVEAVDKYLREINAEYVKQRNRRQIKKRLLALDSEFARKHFENAGDMTDVKLARLAITPFQTSIQIYDNKIAYITMTEDNIFSTIIEDPSIYSLNKALFENMWQHS